MVRSRLVVGLAAVNEAAELLEQRAKTERERDKADDEDVKRVDRGLTDIEKRSREAIKKELGTMLDEILLRLERLHS